MLFSKTNKQTVIGLFLFAGYILQLVYPWSKSEVIRFQNQDDVRLITGILLLLLLVSQWILTFARVILELNDHKLVKIKTWHKWTGAISPLFYLTHSIEPGYGMLFFLTIIFFSNHVIASVYGKSAFWTRVFPVWLLIHILLSVLITILVPYHIYLVSAY